MKKLSKICLITALFALLISLGLSGNTFAQAETYKIGFVDLQRVIDASRQGQQAQEELKQKADELAAQVNLMKQQIQELKDDYETQALALTASARTEKRDDISRKEVDFKRFVQDSQSELRVIEQRALKQLLEDVGKLVVEYGKNNNYTMIFEAGNILYGSQAIEITADIIEAYNSRN